MPGEVLIRWAARFAVACYLGRLMMDVAGRRDAASQRMARWLWTLGCILFLLHAAAAFHFVHGWSHAAAFEHVRQRTLKDAGWNSGIGIYLNYAFTLLWLSDTLVWWWRLDWSRQRIPYWTVQTVFAFLVIQATIVFGPPIWKVIGVAIVLLMLLSHKRDRSN